MRILTTDIYEGAYLLSKGAELKNIWRDDGNRKRSVIFEFTGSHVKILRENYILGKANANVLQLKEKVNILKDQLFKLIREYEIENRKGVRNEVHRVPVSGTEK